MAMPVLASPSQLGALARSFEGYVVPTFVEVDASTYGILTSVEVAPRDVVHRGQTVATLDRLGRSRAGGGGRVAVVAPITGLVTRCWTTAGEAVARGWPIVSIASGEQVMVVARFSPEDVARLRRGDPATVRLRGAPRAGLTGVVESVIEGVEPGRYEGASDRRTTRVIVALATAPAEALWPGTTAEVEIAT